MDNKAQESGSRNVSSNSPGNQGKGIHKLVLQSVTHKSCLRVKLQLFSTHLTILRLSLPPSALQRNNNNQVLVMSEPYFTVYVGLLCVTGDGYWAMGGRSFVPSHEQMLVLPTTVLICCLNKKTDLFHLPYLLASLYLMYAAPEMIICFCLLYCLCFMCATKLVC